MDKLLSQLLRKRRRRWGMIGTLYGQTLENMLQLEKMLKQAGGNDGMERADKLLSSTGRWSRKEVRVLIKAGRVRAGETVLRDPGEKLKEETILYVDGESVLAETKVYLMMNKPDGVISSTEDPREKTVLDLLPEHYRKQELFPVGRLDKDTEGLLLLTNDGPLAHHLLSPRHHVEKVYYTKVDGILDAEDIAAFAEGITLRDGTVCQKAGLEILSEPNVALVRLREGKYHQVKRMLASRGKPVIYLKRLSMGTLRLDEALSPGEFRPLSEDERKNLAL